MASESFGTLLLSASASDSFDRYLSWRARGFVDGTVVVRVDIPSLVITKKIQFVFKQRLSGFTHNVHTDVAK